MTSAQEDKLFTILDNLAIAVGTVNNSIQALAEVTKILDGLIKRLEEKR